MNLLPARRCRRLPGALALGLLLAATGCSSSRPLPSTHPRTADAVRAAPLEPVATSPAVVMQLRQAADPWIGVPYRLGGTTRQGIDCSAFVQTFFHEVLALSLPRTTAEQVRTGATVPRHSLQPGDLVFFRPSRKSRHVGVYLSDGEFVHASTSRGVMISSLETPYWQDAYWTARRLPMPHAPPPRTAARRSRKGVGW